MKRIVNESELPAIYISLSSFILMLRRLSLALSSHCSVKAESCIRGKPSPYRRLLFSPAYSVDLDKLSSTSVGTEARNTSENLPSNLRELGYRYGGNGKLFRISQCLYPSTAHAHSSIPSKSWLPMAPSTDYHSPSIRLYRDASVLRYTAVTPSSRCLSCKIKTCISRIVHPVWYCEAKET
ncbi:hypothetical protein EDD85DRAFT_959246 [Armillaria nabsnona]|nr:hypothetical protein EDD85DRAFT_959246 [Armillaria nabsnona]